MRSSAWTRFLTGLMICAPLLVPSTVEARLFGRRRIFSRPSHSYAQQRQYQQPRYTTPRVAPKPVPKVEPIKPQAQPQVEAKSEPAIATKPPATSRFLSPYPTLNPEPKVDAKVAEEVSTPQPSIQALWDEVKSGAKLLKEGKRTPEIEHAVGSNLDELVGQMEEKAKKGLKIGLVLGNEDMKLAFRRFVTMFLQSPEGRQFLKDNEANIQALLKGTGGSAAGSAFQNNLRQALKVRGPAFLKNLGMSDNEALNYMSGLVDKSDAQVHATIFFDKDLIKQALDETMKIMLEEGGVRAKVQRSAAEQAEKAVIAKVPAKYQRFVGQKRGLRARIVNGKLNEALPDAKRGAQRGALDALEGKPFHSRGSETEQLAYQKAYDSARGQVDRLAHNIESNIGALLTDPLNDMFKEKQLNARVDVIPAVKSRNSDKFADFSYVSFYDFVDGPSGRPERKTYLGQYVTGDKGPVDFEQVLALSYKDKRPQALGVAPKAK